MRISRKGERGFTLIELLIVVAILGVLAAVVIPNVGRFIGRGTTEAQKTEFATIQAAVQSMMTDNNLVTLPNSVNVTRTNNMTAFPDATSVAGSADKLKDILGNTYVSPGDKDGYLLYAHDRIADSDNATLSNYTAQPTTAYWYTVTADGTVTQYTTPS